MGISRDKTRGALRPELPTLWFDLRMWQSAFAHATHLNHEGCIACSKEETGPTHKCCICLLVFHDACQERNLDATKGRVTSAELLSKMAAAFRTRIQTKQVWTLPAVFFVATSDVRIPLDSAVRPGQNAFGVAKLVQVYSGSLLTSRVCLQHSIGQSE